MITDEAIDRYIKNPVLFLKEQYIMLNGKPVQLMPEQEDFLNQLFLAKDEDGRRKHNLTIYSTPKKNGKSETGAMLATIFTFLEEPGGEIIFAAVDKEQASVVMWKRYQDALKRNPELKASVKFYRDAVEVLATGTVARVISSDAPSSHGFNANLILFDELWAFRNRDFYDALTHSPARKQPLTSIFTYAGYDTTSLLYSLYETGLKKSDPNMLFFWTEENIAPWIDQKYLDQQLRRLPPHVFQRLHQNKWSGGTGAFLTRQDVEQCINSNLTPRLTGKPSCSYIMALDLGLKKDRSCVTIVHSDPKTNKIILDRIQTWQGSRDDPVLIADIEQFLEASFKNFYINALVVDPWQAASTIQKFRSKGFSVIEFCFTSSSLTKLSQNLYFLIHNQLFEMFDDPGLKDELLQVNMVEKSYGFRIDHESGRFSDRVISLGMAVLEATNQPCSNPKNIVRVLDTGPAYRPNRFTIYG